MSPYIVGALVTLAAIYVLGFAVTVVIVAAARPWRVSPPRRDRWEYRWWGIPLAVGLNGLLWPAVLYRAATD